MPYMLTIQVKFASKAVALDALDDLRTVVEDLPQSDMPYQEAMFNVEESD